MKRESALYALMFALFFAGILSAFADRPRIGGIALIAAGVVSATFSRSLAIAQNEMAKRSAKFTWRTRTESRPLMFIVWGFGVIVVGVAWLLGR